MRDPIRPPTAHRPRSRWVDRLVAGCLLAVGAGCSEAATGPGSATVAGPRLQPR